MYSSRLVVRGGTLGGNNSWEDNEMRWRNYLPKCLGAEYFPRGSEESVLAVCFQHQGAGLVE